MRVRKGCALESKMRCIGVCFDINLIERIEFVMGCLKFRQ